MSDAPDVKKIIKKVSVWIEFSFDSKAPSREAGKSQTQSECFYICYIFDSLWLLKSYSLTLQFFSSCRPFTLNPLTTKCDSPQLSLKIPKSCVSVHTVLMKKNSELVINASSSDVNLRYKHQMMRESNSAVRRNHELRIKINTKKDVKERFMELRLFQWFRLVWGEDRGSCCPRLTFPLVYLEPAAGNRSFLSESNVFNHVSLTFLLFRSDWEEIGAGVGATGSPPIHPRLDLKVSVSFDSTVRIDVRRARRPSALTSFHRP